MPERDRVFADTATLYPISIADLLLRLAEIDVIEFVWSDHLLDEVTRVLVEDKHLLRAAAVYFCDCIRDTFPTGRVERSAYEHLLLTRTGPDPDDHEHSAAAIAGEATVLLSADKTGFPFRDTKPVQRRHPDDYLTEILHRFPDETLHAITEMGRSRKQPQPAEDVLSALRRAGSDVSQHERSNSSEFPPVIELSVVSSNECRLEEMSG